MITNPIQPNPIFETLPPPWQLSILDAWMASVNQAMNLLYADPSSFNAALSSTLVVQPNFQGVVFSSVNFQTSDNPYNNVTGIFTAPVAGIYRFECQTVLSWPSGSSGVNMWFSQNGATLLFPGAYEFIAADGSLAPGVVGGGAVTVSMAANDTMAIKINNFGAHPVNVASGASTWFSGSIVR